MGQIVGLRQKSNDQLNTRLKQIKIGLIRIRGYTHGNCMIPAQVSSVKKVTKNKGSSENTKLSHKLRREKAQILTILNERANRKKQK